MVSAKASRLIQSATTAIRNLVSEGASVRRTAQTLMRDHAEACEIAESYWEQCNPTISNLPQSLLTKLFVYAWVRRERRTLLCDHNYVDVSEAGPDSGNVDHECSKCGHYVHASLY